MFLKIVIHLSYKNELKTINLTSPYCHQLISLHRISTMKLKFMLKQIFNSIFLED